MKTTTTISGRLEGTAPTPEETITVPVLRESARGCGYRKPGGTYMVALDPATLGGCGRFPFPLEVCPCCHAGIKPSRGFQWVGKEIIPACSNAVMRNPKVCGTCTLAIIPDRFGLIWVGEKFYPTPEAFLAEAATMGVSRRLAQVPKELVVGETVVLLAHRKALSALGKSVPGVFAWFVPTAIQYVVRNDDSESKLKRLRKRGIDPVRVEQDNLLLDVPPTVSPRRQWEWEQGISVVRRDGSFVALHRQRGEESPAVSDRDLAVDLLCKVMQIPTYEERVMKGVA